MLTDAFEEVYVINMSRRSDRYERFAQNLPEDWPFRVPRRYDALDGGLVPAPLWWKGGNGAWGCYRTQLRILEDCLNRDVSSVLILEDDAVCVQNFREKLEMFWSHLPEDWQMLYLGGQHIHENKGLPRKINEWVYKPFNVNRCHCYGFRGRVMMERTYRHLNDFASWNVDHHIDHYLGELHPNIETGLYVPKEWLVAQSEGQSDICGEKLELRLFPSTEQTLSPEIDLPCLAVTGTYFSGINAISGTLKMLGAYPGFDLGKPEPNRPHFFEETYLGEICRNCYTEPWLLENLPKSDRINHLRRWAGLQCKRKPDGTSLLYGKHPILSLMGEELMEAWNAPKFLCVERDDDECYGAMSLMPWLWHPTAAKHSFPMLRRQREAFFENHNPELLRIHYRDMIENPERTVFTICDFLNLSVGKSRKKRASAFLRQCENDFCIEKETANPTGSVSG